jgi:hypothetical protein
MQVYFKSKLFFGVAPFIKKQIAFPDENSAFWNSILRTRLLQQVQ